MQLPSWRFKPTALALANPQKQHTLKVRYQADTASHRGAYSTSNPSKGHLRSVGSLEPSPQWQQHDSHSSADVSDSRGNVCSTTSTSCSTSSELPWYSDDDASCSSPAAAMVSFLSAYGLQPADMQRLTQVRAQEGVCLGGGGIKGVVEKGREREDEKGRC